MTPCQSSSLLSPLLFIVLVQVKAETKPLVSKPKSSSCKKVLAEDKSKDEAGEECRAEEQAFLVALYKYMKERKTPIERIPYLGFKQSKFSLSSLSLKLLVFKVSINNL